VGGYFALLVRLPVLALTSERMNVIDGLIGGKLYGKAAQRKSGNGKTYYTVKVRAAAGEGDALFVNVITFSGAVGETLLALDDGDSVSLSGALTPKVWTPPNGEPRPVLDMVAHGVLTAYHVTRKRQAVGQQAEAPAGKHPRVQRVPAADGLDNDLPWEQ
jgi:single-stranded DNA-binding protein